MRRKNLKWAAFVVMAMVVIGCGPNEETDPIGSIRQATGSPLTWYNAADAVAYATKNWNDRTGPKPFHFFTLLDPDTGKPYGVNCANFVSQCILAGLTGISSDDPTTVHSFRDNFDDDATSRTKSIKWYYHTGGDHGAAWTSTTNMWNYAKQSVSESYGLRWAYITHNTRAKPDDFYVETVQPGDVVFVQWFDDPKGLYHHTMIVVATDSDTTKNPWIASTSPRRPVLRAVRSCGTCIIPVNLRSSRYTDRGISTPDPNLRGVRHKT